MATPSITNVEAAAGGAVRGRHHPARSARRLGLVRSPTGLHSAHARSVHGPGRPVEGIQGLAAHLARVTRDQPPSTSRSRLIENVEDTTLTPARRRASLRELSVIASVLRKLRQPNRRAQPTQAAKANTAIMVVSSASNAIHRDVPPKRRQCSPHADLPRSSSPASGCASIGMARPKTAPTAASLQSDHQRNHAPGSARRRRACSSA